MRNRVRFKGEFTQNRFKNDLKHTAGVLSMARAMHPNSAGSQFFIMHKDAPHLDGAYAAFGKITEGMDVVNRIAEEDTDYSDRPLDEQKIKSMTVEKAITEGTNGRAKMKKEKDLYYSVIDGEVKVFTD